MSNTAAAPSGAFNRPDPLATCKEFLSELSRGIPEAERLMVVYTPQVPGNDPEGRSKFWPQTWRPDKDIKTNENSYAVISSSVKTLHKGKLKYWRSNENFGHALALLVDDIGTGKGSKGKLTLKEISEILKPTAVVETSPDNFQCWYFFDKPEPNKARFKALLTTFADKVLKGRGGDQSITDIQRVGRMPIGINNKRLQDGSLKYSKDWMVRLVIEATDYERRYSMDDIARAFGFEIVVPKPRMIGDNSDNSTDGFFLKLAEVAFGPLASNGKNRIVCPWTGEHSGPSADDAYFWGPQAKQDHQYGFSCSHETCKINKRSWASFISLILAPDDLLDEYAIEQHKINADAIAAAANDPFLSLFAAVDEEPAATSADAETRTAEGWKVASPKEQAEAAAAAAVAKRDQEGRDRSRAIGAGEEDTDKFPSQRIMTAEQMLEECVLLIDGKRVSFLNQPRQVMSFGDFEARTSGSYSFLGDKTPKRVQHSKLWLDSKERKSVWSQTFAPGRRAVCIDPHGNKCQNLWLPIIRPRIVCYEHLAQPFFDHIAYLVPIEAERERFLDWLAHIEQFPGTLPHTHYLMIAKQTGIGRNLMAGALVRLWRGYVASSLDMYGMLKSGYNGQLAGKLLFISDEIHAGAPSRETSQLTERMNMMFTEYERNINPKYGRQHVEFNCCRGLLLSNHIDATPILGTDRREIVIRNPDERMPPAYYSKLYAMLENAEFIHAIGLALRARDVSAFNPGALAPMNEIKQRVISAGRSDVEKVARDIVDMWPSDCISSPRFGYELSAALGHDVKSFSAALARIDGPVNLGRKVRVNGGPVNVWILRDANKWEGEQSDKIAEELLRGEHEEAKMQVAAKAKIGLNITEQQYKAEVQARIEARSSSNKNRESF